MTSTNLVPITPRSRIDRGVLPAAFIAKTTHDPAAMVKGAPRNFGREVMPHIFSVAGRIGSISRTYPWYDEALRDSRTNANAMRRDTGIMECLEARQRATALLKWHIEPRDSKDEAAKDLADKVTAILEETWEFLELRRNLLEALWYGRHMTSHRFSMERVDGHWRQTIGLWTPRHGDKIVFRFDDGSGRYDPKQIGIRLSGGWRWDQADIDYQGYSRDKIEVCTQFGLVYWLDQYEREMVALHRHLIEDGEFYDPRDMGRVCGVGIRDRIYWDWYAMREVLSNALDFIERNAHGIEIWRYPAGNPQAEARTIEAAQNRSNKAVLLVPVQPGELADLQSVEVIEPGFAGLDSLMGIIQTWFAHRIKRYILGQTLTSEAAATGLGSGVADAHMATFADIVRYDAYKLEETITRDIVRSLQLFNFPDSVDYKLLFRLDTEAEDMESKLQAWEAAWNMGAKIPALDLLSLIGSRMPDEQEEYLQNPAIMQAEQQMAMNQQQMEMQALQMQMGGPQMGQPGQPGGQWQGSGTTTYPPMGDAGGDVQSSGEEVDMSRPGEPHRYAQDEDGEADNQWYPSEAQRRAGNYEKKHMRWHGLRISIENEQGTRRRPEWPPMAADYGYVRGTTGNDGDHVDCFVGPHLDSDVVYVIDQRSPSGRYFDEHKAMLGFATRQDAVEAYTASYHDGRTPKAVTAMTADQFVAWLTDGDTTRPVAPQVSRFAQTGHAQRAPAPPGAAWDEQQHPRQQAGQFAPKTQSAPGVAGRPFPQTKPQQPQAPTRPVRQPAAPAQDGPKRHPVAGAAASLADDALILGALPAAHAIGQRMDKKSVAKATQAVGKPTVDAVHALHQGLRAGESAMFHVPLPQLGDHALRNGLSLDAAIAAHTKHVGARLAKLFGKGNVKFLGHDLDTGLQWTVKKTAAPSIKRAAGKAAIATARVMGKGALVAGKGLGRTALTAARFIHSQEPDYTATVTRYGLRWEEAKHPRAQDGKFTSGHGVPEQSHEEDTEFALRDELVKPRWYKTAAGKRAKFKDSEGHEFTFVVESEYTAYASSPTVRRLMEKVISIDSSWQRSRIANVSFYQNRGGYHVYQGANTGHSREVFRHVLGACQSLLAKQDYSAIAFTGASKDHEKLYGYLMAKLGKDDPNYVPLRLGSSDHPVYVLVRKDLMQIVEGLDFKDYTPAVTAAYQEAEAKTGDNEIWEVRCRAYGRNAVEAFQGGRFHTAIDSAKEAAYWEKTGTGKDDIWGPLWNLIEKSYRDQIPVYRYSLEHDWQAVKYAAAEWDESLHPREDDGKFATKGTGRSYAKSNTARAKTHTPGEPKFSEVVKKIKVKKPLRDRPVQAVLEWGGLTAAGFAAYRAGKWIVAKLLASDFFAGPLESPKRFQLTLRSSFAKGMIGYLAFQVTRRAMKLALTKGIEGGEALVDEAHKLGVDVVEQTHDVFDELDPGHEATILFKTRTNVRIPIDQRREVIEATLVAMFGKENVQPKTIDIEHGTLQYKVRKPDAVGARAIVPRIAAAHVAQQGPAARRMTILDFGAGKDAAHARALRQKGYDVTAYDFGSNVGEHHDPQALDRQYDVVYASNVLNVQDSPQMLADTLQEIRESTKPGGTVIVNLPDSPRKGAWEGLTGKAAAERMEQLLAEHIGQPERVKGVGGLAWKVVAK